MPKTLFIVLIFIIFAIFISIAFSLFFTPKEEKLRYEECVLLQNPKTGEVDCFGCANEICKDAPIDWILYEKPEIGIPYACFETEQGCRLAQ